MSRLRNIPKAHDIVSNSKWVVKNPASMKGKWSDVFPDKNKELHIEIGMGKGRFIMDMAKAHPDINFLGLELYESVIYRALQKMQERCDANEEPENVRFICADATNISDFFEMGEITKIYLNFSDPWPKDRHAKRRLPSRQFLERYDKFLAADGTIEFKTDNEGLFDFALEELEPAGWELLKCTRDLHHDAQMNVGNIMTEYEQKFSEKGNPIYKYIIRRKDK